MIAGVSVFDPMLAGTVVTVTVALFVIVSFATKPRPEALDFKTELKEELEHHRVW